MNRTGVFIKIGIWIQRQTLTVGRQPCDWSNVSTSQGKPRLAGKYQKLEESRKHAALQQVRKSMALLTP